jgi:hypothetical protein
MCTPHYQLTAKFATERIAHGQCNHQRLPTITTRGEAMKPANDNLADDVLKGAEAIAAYLGEDTRSVFYQIRKGTLPHYRCGGIRARKSVLTAWIASQEAAARAA